MKTNKDANGRTIEDERAVANQAQSAGGCGELRATIGRLPVRDRRAGVAMTAPALPLAARIAIAARGIAHRESPTGTVSPAHVIRAAIECGAGRPGSPLTAALQGQVACGYRLSEGEWAEAIRAMMSVGALDCDGGRWVIDDEKAEPRRVA